MSLRPSLPTLLALGCVATFLPPARARADTSGGSGPYELRVHTCAAAPGQSAVIPGTKNPVEVVIQSGGKAVVKQLDNAGDDRAAAGTDSYRFAWPSEIGSVDQLEALTLQKFGNDAWCVDKIELFYDTPLGDRLWAFDSNTTLPTTDQYIGPHPRTGAIWMDDNDNSPASLVRFTDLAVTYDKTVSAPFERDETVTFITTTCAKAPTPVPNDPIDNDNVVRLRFAHEGLIDDLRLDTNDLDVRELGKSDYYFPYPNPAGGVTAGGKHRMWGVKLISSVRVDVTNNDSWCFTKLAINGAFLNGGKSWTYANTSGRNLDTNSTQIPSYASWGSASSPLNAGPFIATSATASNNVMGLLGLPLQRASAFRADVLACAKSANNQSVECLKLDRDNDGLPDAVEKSLSTDPENPDTDGDAIDDGVEVYGINGVDYPGFGANPRHKDVFIEVDYEYWEDVNGTHSAALPPAAEQKLKALYEALDIPNPDLDPGLAIHLVYDGQLPYPANCSGLYKTTEDFTPARRDGFHYARLCVKDDTTTSWVAGQAAGVPGRRLYTSIKEHNANAGDDLQEPEVFYQFAVLAHELGHSLGLSHGGVPSPNCKPNYPSLMNYSYDYDYAASPQTIAGTRIRFSMGTMPELDENKGISEVNWGLPGADLSFLTSYDGAGFRVSGSSVDFNRDGDTDDAFVGVVRSGPQCSGLDTPSLLEDIDDHARMSMLFSLGIPGAVWVPPTSPTTTAARPTAISPSKQRLDAKRTRALQLGADPDSTEICY